MDFIIEITTDGKILFNDTEDKHVKPNRKHKGKSNIDFPLNYTIVDIETTGLDTQFCDIIEIAAIKVRNGIIENTYSSLINIGYRIDDFISELTGITNEMLIEAPDSLTVISDFAKFVEDDIVIGHNVNFDINFIYDAFENLLHIHFSNSYIDTLRLSRKLLPELQHHRLIDMAEYFNIETTEYHRAFADCMSTYAVYKALNELALSKYGSYEIAKNALMPKRTPKKFIYDISSIKAQTTELDITHPLYNKVCVFTGTLDKMKRTDAMQLVVNVGGLISNSVTKKTNYLILGNNDYCKSIKNGKSNKQKKAESLALAGQDIDIISESTFYQLFDI